MRANEQVGLTALHTLFVREHNLIASMIARYGPDLTGEEIYHAARAVVAAEMQVITYKEFLPKCGGCAEVIKEGRWHVYEGASFHYDCFKCHACRKPAGEG